MGKDKNRHASKKKGYNDDKGMVFGALETSTGKVKTKVLPDTTGKSLQGAVKQFVHEGSIMVRDDHRGYTALKNNYARVMIKHSVGGVC